MIDKYYPHFIHKYVQAQRNQVIWQWHGWIWQSPWVPNYCSVGIVCKTGTCQVLWEQLGVLVCSTRWDSAEIKRISRVAMQRRWVSRTRKQCAWNPKAGENWKCPENSPGVKHGGTHCEECACPAMREGALGKLADQGEIKSHCQGVCLGRFEGRERRTQWLFR